MKAVLRRIIQRVSGRATVPSLMEQESRANVELVLATLLQKENLDNLQDVVAFTAGIRQCIAPARCEVRFVKRATGARADPDKTFDAFAELLSKATPPVPLGLALRFARVADEYRGMHKIVQKETRATDISRHFSIASSSGRKGRLLAAAVNHFAPKVVLELGTAYGISALFIASVLRDMQCEHPRRLITVEGYEPQATLSRTLLEREFGDLVQCESGLSREALPRLAGSIERIDLYFHDAGHSYDDYVNDVGMMLPLMPSGSVLMLDDIRWDDPFAKRPSRTYKGWQTVVGNARIRAAAEIDNELGIAMIG